ILPLSPSSLELFFFKTPTVSKYTTEKQGSLPANVTISALPILSYISLIINHIHPSQFLQIQSDISPLHVNKKKKKMKELKMSAASFDFSSASPPSTPSSRAPSSHDYSFKILMVGDSAVGKSSILLRFISDSDHHPSPTIGVDFKMKTVMVNDKKLKLTIWDTVYDITKRETFTSLSEMWARDVELYSTNHDCVKLLVGNKVDKVSERAVSREEGMVLAHELKCPFLECTARSRQNIEQIFRVLLSKIYEVPTLLEKGSGVTKASTIRADRQASTQGRRNNCCSS
ncbi:Ras-related protein RABC2a, partial [Linum perenne]